MSCDHLAPTRGLVLFLLDMDAHADQPWHDKHGPAPGDTRLPVRRDSVESLDLLDGYVYGDFSETSNDSSEHRPPPARQSQQLHHYSHQAHLPPRESSLQHHQRLPAHAYSQSESIWPSRAPPSRQPSPGHARSQTFDAAGAAAAAPVPPAIVTHTIKRKPLSSTASPLIARYSSRGSSPTGSTYSQRDLPKPETRFSRTCSIDSPTLYDYPASGRAGFDSDIEEEEGFAQLPAPLHIQSCVLLAFHPMFAALCPGSWWIVSQTIPIALAYHGHG